MKADGIQLGLTESRFGAVRFRVGGSGLTADAVELTTTNGKPSNPGPGFPFITSNRSARFGLGSKYGVPAERRNNAAA